MVDERCPEGANFRIVAPDERDEPSSSPPAGRAAPAALRDFGRAVTLLRIARGLRQEDVARAMGRRQSGISRVESGAKTFSMESLERQVAAMGLPLSMFAEALTFMGRVRAAGRERQAAPTTGRAEPLSLAGPPRSSSAELAREAARLIVGERRRPGPAGCDPSCLTPAEARRGAHDFWSRLVPYAASERRALVREMPKMQSWALCELICAESEKAAAHDAATAIALGELAVEVAVLAPGEESWRRRLLGYALAFRANAIRVSGRLAAAGEAFDRALTVWASGFPVDAAPLDVSRLLDLEASLRRGQRRLDEALELLDRALAVHPAGPAAARLLLKRAKTLEELGDYEGAVANLRQAAPQIDPERDLRLPLVLRLNLAWDLCQLGRAGEGEELLPEARALAGRLGNHLDLVRLRWIEGLVAGGRGRTQDALAAFEEVRSRFAALDMAYDAALATLQLAGLYAAEGGHAAEVKALAAQAAPIFNAEKVHPEARKALALFQRAAAEERVTAELARAVASYLERARGDPGMRFEGGG
jgi:tetratricopeptide (TPR) repeat protein/transcriptional regulator with XRE-family HTH domain